MTSFPRTSVTNWLGSPGLYPGASKVEVWHHGLSLSSSVMTPAKHSDHPGRGYAETTVRISSGWMRFARLWAVALVGLVGMLSVPTQSRAADESHTHRPTLSKIVASCRICPIMVILPLGRSYCSQTDRFQQRENGDKPFDENVLMTHDGLAHAICLVLWPTSR
jgi:hypothetical protein